MDEWQEAEHRVQRARELLAQHRLEEAMEEMCAAVAADPANAVWRYNLGVVLRALDRFAEAAAAFERAVELAPDFRDAAYEAGDCLERLGRFAEAIAKFDLAESIDPSFERAYCARVAAYAAMGDHDRAEQMFYLARQYREECPRCYNAIARSLLERGLVDRAIYCWQRALDLDENAPMARLGLGQACRAKGDLESARKHLALQCCLTPFDWRPQVELGLLLMEMGQRDRAGRWFYRAAENGPREGVVHYHLGRWLAAAGRPDAGETALEQALRLDPDLAGPNLELAKLCLARGDEPQARRHLRAEMDRGPHDRHALSEMAELMLDCRMHRAAAACLRKAVAVDGGDAPTWVSLGVAHFMLGEFDDGMQATRRALRADRSCDVAMYNMALACYAQGRLPRALAWLRKAGRVNPDDIPAQSLRLRVRLAMLWRRLAGPFRGGA